MEFLLHVRGIVTVTEGDEMSGCGSLTVFGIVGGGCHKYHFCRDKILCLCRDEGFLSRPAYFCRDKHVFVAIKVSLSRQKFYSFYHGVHSFVTLVLRRVVSGEVPTGTEIPGGVCVWGGGGVGGGGATIPNSSTPSATE